MSANFYSAPTIDEPARPAVTVEGDEAITPRILLAMNQTRPWVTLFAVFGFLGAGVCVLLGLAVAISAPTDMSGAIGLVYLVAAAIYGVSGNLLYRYRTSLAALGRGYGIHALENALEHQKSFWRFSGILFAIFLGFNLLLFLGGVAMGIAAAM